MEIMWRFRLSDSNEKISTVMFLWYSRIKSCICRYKWDKYRFMRIWSNIVITYWIIWKEELKHLFTVYYWWLCVWYFKLVRTDPIGTVYIVNKSNETIFVGASQLLEAGDSLSLKNLSMEYFLTGKTESGDTTYVQSNLDGLKTYNSTFQIIILKSST